MKKAIIIVVIVIAIIAGIILIGLFAYQSMYNRISNMEEIVRLMMGNLQAQYQRREILISNLVEMIKEDTTLDKKKLEDVINAKMKASQIEIDLRNPESVKAYRRAQSELSQALNRLMVEIEKNPNLRVDEKIIELNSQLEDTENRIKQAKIDCNNAVKDFNMYVRSFFISMIFRGRYPDKPYFEAEKGAEMHRDYNF